ncbi:TOG array regulator of axonemal microtubules protein 2-like isoform X2 [Takifugu rubripes]|uniref:TOG array regulator of axonemal microtubules protein 2-like isoform X2 n=1 Tax=Takifugu rubripes TaxID=31033 RepID=UPI0011459523|nr:TOG array regulator of axonemal microtubules protein 2-like isoform X2 [Takifugu rubripes]
MKGNQQKHVGKSMAKVAPRASAPQHGRGTRAATFTTADSAQQNFTGSRVGNKPKVDSCRIQNLPRKYSENCEKLMTPSSAKTLLISALENFSSKDWKKHMEGLLQLKTLAQDHPAILKDRLQQVCVKICSEISSNRSAVSCEAMETMGVLYEHLPPDMNRLVDLTGVPLLARFASLQGLRERATITLEKMVDHCNPNKVLDFLLSKGMSHRCGAVRDGTAYLLTLLAKKMGITKILKSKSFIIVITKMCLDSSPKTRCFDLRQRSNLSYIDLCLPPSQR